MEVSLQTKNNAAIISKVKNCGLQFTSAEIFKGKNSNHKFDCGQKCELVGLEDYPEYNGSIVEISAIRENGEYGKAYYFKTDNNKLSNQLNWVYEYRLRKI